MQLASYSIQIDSDDTDAEPTRISGIIIVTSEGHNYSSELQKEVVPSEQDLLSSLARLVRKHDPDILVGYDAQRASWGFVLKRASHLGLSLDSSDFTSAISRVPFHKRSSQEPQAHAYNEAHSCDIVIPGRVVINLWRVVRGDVDKMRIYSFEAACLHILHRRLPRYSCDVLTTMFSRGGHDRHRLVQHLATRTAANFMLMDKLDVINKCSEHARVMGIDLESVCSL